MSKTLRIHPVLSHLVHFACSFIDLHNPRIICILQTLRILNSVVSPLESSDQFLIAQELQGLDFVWLCNHYSFSRRVFNYFVGIRVCERRYYDCTVVRRHCDGTLFLQFHFYEYFVYSFCLHNPNIISISLYCSSTIYCF